MKQHYAFLGASRGLGWATYKLLSQRESLRPFLLSARQIQARHGEVGVATQLVTQDFSRGSVDQAYLDTLQRFDPSLLIYFAGGGPYGDFAKKKWSDHQWALNTTFLYPAELTHRIVSQRKQWPSLKRLILIGSAIAESQPDPQAASYAAAKHALKALVTTLRLESHPGLDIQLFSPGYMQTDLLPVNSRPRQIGLAEDPLDVAKKLIAFIEKND